MKKHALLDHEATEKAIAFKKTVEPVRRITFAAAVNELVGYGYQVVFPPKTKKSTTK